MGFDPLTLAAGGFSAGSSLIEGLGGAREASASAEASRFRGAVALRNMVIAQQNAERAVQQGYNDAQTIGLAGAAQKGSIASAQGASGIDLGSGSSRAVRGSAASQIRLAELGALDKARLEAYNYNVQAQGFGLEALGAQRASQSYESAIPFIVGKSLIGGATSFASKWSQAKRAGAF